MPERKTLNRTYFCRGSSANPPRLHTCENKVPFWDYSQFRVTTTLKISNRKKLTHDSIHRFWLKKSTSIHDRLPVEMNRSQQAADVLEWMTKGKTTLIQKDSIKGTAPNNYRPITCLLMMW